MARTLTLFFLVAVFCNTTLAQVPALGQDPMLDFDIKEFNACGALKDGSPFKPFGEIRTQVPIDENRMPPDCSGEFFSTRVAGDEARFASDISYQWLPTNFFYMPPYFDDVPLERYGQTKHRCLQPFISGSRFFLQVPALPYKMGVDPPHTCVTTLGHQPPGNCVPCIKQTLPHSGDATFVQAAATVGLVFLLP